jgi:hypothetical protein
MPIAIRVNPGLLSPLAASGLSRMASRLRLKTKRKD